MSDTALILADELDHGIGTIDRARHEAAAELRRLHAENEALREANEAFGKRQEWWNDKMVALEAINAELREALRRVKGTGVFLGAIAQEMVDAALAKAGVSK